MSDTDPSGLVSAHSPYGQTTIAGRTDSSLGGRLPERAQVVIVGGGIVGASVAYHLALRGVTDVVLLERHTLTSGTTWHAAGLVAQLRATHNMTRLAAYSGELYEQLEQDGFPTGFRRTGSIAVAADRERLEELTRGADMARCFGVEVNPVGVDELVRFWPHLHAQDLVGGVHVPDDGQTSPVDTTMALVAAAKANGVRVIEHLPVTALRHEHERVTGVETAEGPIEADKVVSCAGMWTRHLAATAGVSVPLHGCEHFYIVTEPIEGLGRGLPTLRDPGSNVYIKEETGRLLVGAFEPVAKPIDVDELPPDGSFIHLDDDWDHLAPQIEAAIHRVPIIGETGIRLFFNGPESFTPDDAYLLGETPELAGHFVAAGFNSVGIQSAGGAGRVLADWVIDGRPPMDLGDVDIRRMHPFQGTRRYLRDRVTETLGLLYEMHWPYRQKQSARGARHSAVHDRLVAAGACMGETMGWERPNWYAAPGESAEYRYTYGRQNWFERSAAEHLGTRSTAGLFDMSSYSKFLVQGPDSARVLDRISANSVDVEIGRTVYTQWCNEAGGIEADLTVSRQADDKFLVVSPVAGQVRDFDWLRRHIDHDERAVATDVTSGYAMLAVMGPAARNILQPLTDADLSHEAFGFGTTQTIDIGYALVEAIRLTYVGELGWELYVPTEFARHVYEQVVESGAEHGLVHAGFHAMNSLRCEKGYRHWGHDITDEDTPLEAGLGFAIDWAKTSDFIGRDALAARRAAGVGRRLVQFRLLDPAPLLYHDEPIFRDGVLVGHTTSGAFGHSLGASVGMGYVETGPEMARPEVLDAGFEIQVNGVRYEASASYRPLHDPDSTSIHT